MTKLYVAWLRHADYHQQPDTPSAHQPFCLHAQGRQQAEKAVQCLQKLVAKNKWKFHPIIDSSRLLRSWQTAQIIADGIKEINTVESYDELAERSLGCAANLTIRQIETVIHDDPRFAHLPENWKSDSHYCLPLQGAESLMQAGRRVADHLIKTITMLRADPAINRNCTRLKIFVGHGAAFRHAAYHLGILSMAQLAQLSMFHAQPIVFEIDKQGQWQHKEGEWKSRKDLTRALLE